ncbi:MAG: YIP1 family protein [Paracoccaceae bacterium]|jgi:nitrogen fixation/metabolism regulation signal transduction histidine kinase|nr:YIP1 family protein [Paracoccaceae bacterium]
MSVTNDIVAAYRHPRAIMRRHLNSGAGEERALIFVVASCVIFFVANLPVLSRISHLTQTDMGAELGASIFAWLFIAPLALYVVAAALRIVLRVLGCKSSFFHTRLAIFWSLLATTPLVLLNGLTGGLIGPGIEQNIVGAVWFGAFIWIVAGSIREVCKAS